MRKLATQMCRRTVQ